MASLQTLLATRDALEARLLAAATNLSAPGSHPDSKIAGVQEQEFIASTMKQIEFVNAQIARAEGPWEETSEMRP